VEKRSRWFDEGSSTLRLILEAQGRGHKLPPTGSYYACPCCLVAYPRAAVTDKVLTIEDVPPKVLGGRPMLLTCVECNNRPETAGGLSKSAGFTYGGWKSEPKVLNHGSHSLL